MVTVNGVTDFELARCTPLTYANCGVGTKSPLMSDRHGCRVERAEELNDGGASLPSTMTNLWGMICKSVAMFILLLLCSEMTYYIA